MFTDNPATPVRLEILLEVLQEFERGLPREELLQMLQPEALVEGRAEFTVAKANLRAALDLNLVRDVSGKITIAKGIIGSPRDSVLAALDELVLAGTDVEKYFALYYSFYLGLGKAADDATPDSFNKAVFDDERQENRFNDTKRDGLNRWFYYAGLGWFDPDRNFHANPYYRVLRALPKIFKSDKKLTSEDFMKGLAKACPELDGGELFRQANRGYSPEDKTCTLGLSHALVELHLDREIKLDCPADNNGWSIGPAEPPAAEGFVSNRFRTIEFVGGRKS
jgi:hypothetical protein